MKNVFLAVGLIAFSVASAQLAPTWRGQNDFFDIQKYLLEKNKKDQLITEKAKNVQALKELQFPYITIFHSAIIPKASYCYTLPNGNKVYSLPEDNMSCVVPDMKQFAMPNVTMGDRPGTTDKNISGKIPNAEKPEIIMPGK